MIQLITAGAAGAAIGAAIAVIANLVILPFVLKHNEARAASRGQALPAKNRQMVVAIYRYVMPPLFIGVLGAFSVHEFGGIA